MIPGNKTEKRQMNECSFDPRMLDFTPAAEGLWFETEAEIEAGLEWMETKRILLRWVRREMGRRLTRTERRMVELHYFEALSVREAAARNGTQAHSVRRALRRAEAKLRAAALEESGASTPGAALRALVRRRRRV